MANARAEGEVAQEVADQRGAGHDEGHAGDEMSRVPRAFSRWGAEDCCVGHADLLRGRPGTGAASPTSCVVKPADPSRAPVTSQYRRSRAPMTIVNRGSHHDQWQWSSLGARSSAGLRSKKPKGFSVKPTHLDGHDRPVLGAGDVGGAERVPDHDVGVLDRPVGRRPRGSPSPPGCWLGKSPAARRLVGVERRDPEVLRGERRPAGGWPSRRPASIVGGVARHQLVGDRVADGVALRPGSRSATCRLRAGSTSALRLELGARASASAVERVVVRVVGPGGSATTSTSLTELPAPSTSKSRRKLNRCWWWGAGQVGRDHAWPARARSPSATAWVWTMPVSLTFSWMVPSR